MSNKLVWPAPTSDVPDRSEESAFQKGSAYVDGKIIPIEEAKVPLLDWGFLRSDACQDTVSVWDGSFFRLTDHLDRFERSVQRLRMDTAPVTRSNIHRIVHKLVAVCGFRDAYVQIIMTRGRPPIGSRDLRLCSNSFQAFCVPYMWIANPEKQEIGMAVHVSRRVRIPPQSVDPLVKHYHWLDFEMGLFEAYENGADTVVLTDLDGNITEGPGFNVFAVIDGVLRTPSFGMLDGMTRRTVMELCNELNLDVTQETISLERLLIASEIFLTTTAGGIIPVSSVNGTGIGFGSVGEQTRRIHRSYWDKRSSGWYGEPVAYAQKALLEP
ncbi:aminotransferase protein (plasmid) [Rhizobium sp. CIAT894]|uniref:aminotransferase class IV n=1 Tax=Rhizobium sp. CIAT894 TaxID=2020312 RepID=UPI000A207812|nr:aminotransferase class IV [Rhizobium sp. CIAT894]ARM92236.1 aminotransferase protein [Rhizobium sp. CIAT894]